MVFRVRVTVPPHTGGYKIKNLTLIMMFFFRKDAKCHVLTGITIYLWPVAF